MYNHSFKKLVAKILFVLSIVLAVLTVSCNQPSTNKTGKQNGLHGHISISGAFALYPITVRWAEEFSKLHPDVRIDISAGGAGKGMADALSGMVDLGMFSRGISDAEKKQGVWWVAVTKDAVLPTINDQNPHLDELKSKGITSNGFKNIFLLGKTQIWNSLSGLQGQPKKINVYTRSDACGAAQMWAEFLGSNQESLMGIGVFGDPGMADAVKNDKLAMGYNNVVYIYDIHTRQKYPGLEIFPLDLNKNGRIDPGEDFYETLDSVITAIRDKRYPSPPARELYFVAKEKPENEAVIAFLNWILNDGQRFVGEAGYVELPQTTIDHEITKLKNE